MDAASTRPVITSNFGSLGKKKKVILFFSGLALLIILLVLVIIYAYESNHTKSKLTETQLVTEVETYMSNGQYKKAITLINSQPSSLTKTSTVQSELARAYTQSGDTMAAYTIYNNVAKSNPSLSSDQLAAQTAQAAGNKQGAIYWYQQAEKALPPGGLSQNYAAQFQSDIKQLESK